MIFLDPTPLLDAARNGRPHHLRTACPYCHGRTGNNGTGRGATNNTGRSPDASTLCITDPELADTLGTSIRQIQRWRHGHRIRIRDNDELAAADRMAIAAGTHPLVVWPELDLWKAAAA